MNLQCFLSFATIAFNATLLYDFNEDNKNLWKRENLDVPLPSCSSSFPPPDGRCLVCMEDSVYAVCSNLNDGVKLTLEADQETDFISSTTCPQLRSDSAHTGQLTTANTLGIFLLDVAVMIWAAQ